MFDKLQGELDMILSHNNKSPLVLNSKSSFEIHPTEQMIKSQLALYSKSPNPDLKHT